MAEKTPTRLQRLLIEAMAKHLPPSASELRLLDVNGETGAILAQMREDVAVTPVSGHTAAWSPDEVSAGSVDSIVAFDYVINDDFLRASMQAMRPGGRLIVVNSRGEVTEQLGQKLEQAGFTRILVETAVECPLPTGVLMRGEKPHVTGNTLERVQQVAGQDAAYADLQTYRGRYVHLLVRENPAKPAWKREPGEVVTWEAVALSTADDVALLAFSSLPQAVAFMQPAVLDGRIDGVTKVGKFRREVAQAWERPVLLNGAVDVLDGAPVVFVPVDADTAELPDE
jgi:hypothetical protein